LKKTAKAYGRFITFYHRLPNHYFKLRILEWLNKLFVEIPKKRLVIPYYNKTWLSINSHEYIDHTILIHGTYENEVFEKLMSFADKDEVLWDIGAHIGSFAIKAVTQPSIKKIYCFEPNPKTFELLKFNKELNAGFNKLNINPVGLGHENGSFSFEPNEEGNSGRSRFLNDDSAGESLKLTVTTLDNLVFKNDFTPPTLIKIDVEGFEKYVFMGAEKLFETYPPKFIIFEAEHINTRLKDEYIIHFFKKHGYTVEHVTTLDEMESRYQNFIAFKQ
jgi:FkbM family methyltransferase